MDDLEKAAAKLRAQLEERTRLKGLLKSVPDQFQQRYKSWCMTECVAEYERNFRLLKLVRSGAVPVFLNFVSSLPSQDLKLRFITALCRRWWSDDLNPEEQYLIDDYVQASSRLNSSPETPSFARRKTPAPSFSKRRPHSEVSDRRDIRKLLQEEICSLGEGPLGTLILRNPSALWFEKKIDVGYIVTAVEFSGWTLLKYVQTVYAMPDARPGTNISKGISILTWMGIGQSTWDNLVADDVPETGRALIELASHFFEAAEELLSGMEISKYVGGKD